MDSSNSLNERCPYCGMPVEDANDIDPPAYHCYHPVIEKSRNPPTQGDRNGENSTPEENRE